MDFFSDLKPGKLSSRSLVSGFSITLLFLKSIFEFLLVLSPG
ncbi:hypothetical protein [Leptospira kirschneri]|nr:hypothetical protein [Leptospira kirschneri]